MGVHKVTVREIIEMLAKSGDWDSECTCIDEKSNHMLDKQRKQRTCKIVGLSQSTNTGTQIIFSAAGE